MVTRACSLIAVGLSLVASAQHTEPFAARGLVSGSASIAPGFMRNAPLTNTYLTGDLNYFLEDRISLCGSGAWFVGGQEQGTILKQNSRLSFGPVYHWTKGGLDVGLGLMPGVSLTQLDPMYGGAEATATPLKVLPNVSLTGGVTYYVWKYMHFFANARYAHAQYAAAPTGALSLDELVVSAGLGWQLRLRKKG